MGDTKISWAERTWNPVRGCDEVSPGCARCYAKTMAGRIVAMGKGKPTPYDGLVALKPRRQLQVDANGEPTGRFRDHGTRAYWTGKVAFDPVVLAEPLKRRKPTTYFVNSMSDLFHDGFTFEQIAAVFGVMAATPQHTFIVLTKRAQRMREFFEWLEIEASKQARARWSARHLREEAEIEHARADVAMAGELDACATYADKAVNSQTRGILHCFPVAGEATTWPLPNVILGVSAERQRELDERVPHLLATPAAVRLVSAEPLLGPLDARAYLGAMPSSAAEFDGIPGVRHGIGWVIAGCESGTGARPCEVAWLRSLRDQCVEAEVPFFLKQEKADVLGRTADYPSDTPIMHSMGLCPVIAEGPGSKLKPGGIIELPYLDGVQWVQRPEVPR